MEPDFYFLPGGAVGVRPLKSTNRSTDYCSYLKMVRWYQTSIRTIAWNRIFDFPLAGSVKLRPLKSSTRFTAYSSYPIDLKLFLLFWEENLHHQLLCEQVYKCSLYTVVKDLKMLESCFISANGSGASGWIEIIEQWDPWLHHHHAQLPRTGDCSSSNLNQRNI